jgi:hypothetical protein
MYSIHIKFNIKKMKQTLISLIIVLLLGIGVGFALFSDKQTKEISSTVILNSLNQEGFLVTQSNVYTQDVVIEKSTGSAVKDFFLGQTIQASTVLKVNIGVDLKNITQENITMEGNKVTIQLPSPNISSIEIIDDVKLENEQGIVKKIFDNEDGYNEAIALLKKEVATQAMHEVNVAHVKENTIIKISELLGALHSEDIDIEIIIIE